MLKAELSEDSGTHSAVDADIEGITVEEPGGWPGGKFVGSGGPYISRDEFFERFEYSFAMLQVGVNWRTGLELTSVEIQQREHESARKAADALYALADKYPKYLGWAIKAGSETGNAVAAVGWFGYVKLQTIQAEIEALQQTRNAKPEREGNSE